MTTKNFLRAKDGLIVGIDEKDNFYRVDGYQHLLLMAPTGAGKGVSFVLPNLLSWQESVIVHDIKLENYVLTSGWRASQGQKIYVFDPLSREGKTHCYNPLDFISTSHDLMIDDIQKIANLLLPDNGFWHDHARSLFTVLVLYLMANSSRTKSIGEIYRMLIGDLTKELSQDTKMHKIGTMLMNNFLSKDTQEQSGIISTLASHLSLWSNPLIDKATSKSDFNPADFRKEKSTLYVGLQPSDITRLQPLMQFLYQHIAQNLTSKMPDQKKEPHGILFMLDEFPTLGNMDIFVSCMPYFRGYKVRLLIMVQNLHHLQTAYCHEDAQVILANTTFKISFTPNDYDTAEAISKLSGEHISWQAAMSIGETKQIMIIDNNKPVISKKLHYYDFVEFKDRMIEPIKCKF